MVLMKSVKFDDDFASLQQFFMQLCSLYPDVIYFCSFPSSEDCIQLWTINGNVDIREIYKKAEIKLRLFGLEEEDAR